MTSKPKFCPICYYDVTKCKVIDEQQITGVKQVIHCPKCNTILNCDKSHINVRCINCGRLFAETLSYIDHLDKGVCNYG